MTAAAIIPLVTALRPVLAPESESDAMESGRS